MRKAESAPQEISLALMAVWCFMAIFSDIADAAKQAGTMIDFDGKVTVSDPAMVKWQPAFVSMPLVQGQCVRTGKNSHAALLLTDRSQIRLQANSLLCLSKRGSAPDEKPWQKGIYKFLKGGLWFRNKRKGPKPIFNTPVVTAGIRGTEMAIFVSDASTHVIGLEGQIKCYNRLGQVVVKRGLEAVAKKGTKPILVAVVRPEDKVQWLLLTPEIRGPADSGVMGDKRVLRAISMSEQAIMLIQKGLYFKAVSLAKKAVEMAPQRAACNVAMATVLQAKGHFQEALSYSRKALKADPVSVPALLRTMELLLGLDRIKEAKILLGSFKGAADPRFFMLRGYVALAELRPDGAIKDFKEAISYSAGLAPAHLGLGLCLFQLDRKKEAIDSMEQASLLDPLAAYSHNYLGKALYEIEERDEAEIELLRASQLDPLDPTPYLYLAFLYSDRFLPGKAIAAFRKSLELNDNRFSSRSRFLLDQDRAVRNISLARAFSDMGLIRWSIFRGNLAIWDDPTNSSAYLLRTINGIQNGAIDPQSIADLQRARLLQPVNQNTFVSYQNYQSLLEIPSATGELLAYAGSDKSMGSSAWLSAGNLMAAGDVFGNYDTSDGPVDGAYSRIESLESNFKINVNPVNQFYMHVYANHSNYGDDVMPRLDGHIRDARDISESHDNWLLQAGHHWRQGPGRDLLLLVHAGSGDGSFFQREKFESAYMYGVTSVPFVEFDIRSYSNVQRLQALEFWRQGDHRLYLGGYWQDNYWHRSGKEHFFSTYPPISETIESNLEDHARDYRVYGGDIWHLGRHFMLDAGISWCQMDGYWYKDNGKTRNETKILPSFGIVLKPDASNVFRVGAFSELQPDMDSSMLRPSDVAGFLTITQNVPGTWTRSVNIGWDREWNSRIFSSLSMGYVNSHYPFKLSDYYSRPFTWDHTNTWQGLVSLEFLATEQLATSLTYAINHRHLVDAHRKRLDQVLRCMVTWMNPAGWRARVMGEYVDEDERSGYETPLGENFLIISLYGGKYLFGRKGLVYLKWENITGKRYRVVPYDVPLSMLLPWQDSRLLGGFTWSF